MQGEMKTFKRKIFTSKHPEPMVALIDEIVKNNQEFDTRSDALRRAIEDFFAEGFGELFEGNLYKLVSVRLPKEINSKLNFVYQKSNVFRMALIIFLLKYHYKVIPIE